MDLLKNALGLGQNISDFFKKKKDEFVDFVTPDPQKSAPPKQTAKFTLPKVNFTMPTVKIGGIDVGKTFKYYTGQTPKNPQIERMNREALFNPTNMAKSFERAKQQAGTQDPLQAVIYHGKQAAQQLPQTFPNYVRQTSERAFGPTWGRIIAAPTANTGQAMSQGAIDVYKGSKKLLSVPELIKQAKYGEAAGQTFEGGTKAFFGGAKAIAASTPLFQVFNVMSGMDNKAGRFSRGFARGMTGENLDPDAPKKNIKIGQVEFDPIETAGNMIGFVKNPAWKKIFPVTSQILKVNPSSIPVANFIFQRATKGGLEGYLQAVGNMPDKLTDEDKWKIIQDNVLFGAGAELGFDILGSGVNALKNQKMMVRLMDTLSNEWRRANIPVLDWKTGERIPMWQYRLKDQRGSIDLDAKIENPLKDLGKAPDHTPIVGIDDMIQNTKNKAKGVYFDQLTPQQQTIAIEKYKARTGDTMTDITPQKAFEDIPLDKKTLEPINQAKITEPKPAQQTVGGIRDLEDAKKRLLSVYSTFNEADRAVIQNAKTPEDLAPYLRKLEGGSLAKFFNSGEGQAKQIPRKTKATMD